EVVQDGLARRERRAEIAVDEVADVAQVLRVDRPVEAVLPDQALPLLRARERADQLVDRVPRDDARERERDERDPEQDGDEQDQPARGVPQHRAERDGAAAGTGWDGLGEVRRRSPHLPWIAPTTRSSRGT